MIKVSDSETPFSHQWSKSLEFSFKATTTIVNAISANMPAKMLTSDHIEDAALRKFRDWIATQPHIKNPIVDDNFLLRFLRAKKFNLNDATRTYTLYAKTREQYPHCYQNLDPEEDQIHDLISRGYVFPLPEKDALGRTVIFVRNGAFGQRFGHRATDLYRSLVMTIETLLDDEENQKKGFVYVVDFEGQYFSDIAYVGLFEAQKLARSGEKCYPVQHKEAHWINASPLVKTCFWFLISFVPEHLKKRLRLHRNATSLRAHVGETILPAEYGGKVPWQVMADSWLAKLKEHRPMLLGLDKLRYDESSPAL